jgi:regulatory protein
VTDAPKARPPKSLKARAIGYLARREYARAELRDKLLATGSTPDEVDPVLDDLAAAGYLSDERFAHALVRQKSAGYSKRSIAHALKARGVAGDVATGALDGVEADDAATMVALWRRRFGQAPANDRERARQVRFLQSRGFGLSAIFKLLRDPPVDA